MNKSFDSDWLEKLGWLDELNEPKSSDGAEDGTKASISVDILNKTVYSLFVEQDDSKV